MTSQQTAHNLDEKRRTEDVQVDDNVTFSTLLLSDQVLAGLTNEGFRKPSPIQLKAIPLGRCGFDLIVKAKSGTGKTAVFAIIALENVDPTKKSVQTLVLAPTREIAIQIQIVIKSIGCNIPGLKVESFIGGLPLEDDIAKLKYCHIAIGAPGRIKHLIDMGCLLLSCIRLFVLDEADKLLEKSFQGDINAIYNKLPYKKQMIALSATYPDYLDKFVANYMLSPIHVTPYNEKPILLGLKQYVSVVQCHLNLIQQINIKNDELVRILSQVSYTQCIVFSNYQSQAESISSFLNKKGWPSIYLTGSQTQRERICAINKLKDFKCRILLTTDLTARGIDAANVDLIINYHVPINPATYLHRMGRAGRYGATGLCITLAAEGNEIDLFRKTLGAIGGTELVVAKLPVNRPLTDLWSFETVDKISGVISNETVENNLLSTVQSVKADLKKKIDVVSSNMEVLEVNADCNLLHQIVLKDGFNSICGSSTACDDKILFSSCKDIFKSIGGTKKNSIADTKKCHNFKTVVNNSDKPTFNNCRDIFMSILGDEHKISNVKIKNCEDVLKNVVNYSNLSDKSQDYCTRKRDHYRMVEKNVALLASASLVTCETYLDKDIPQDITQKLKFINTNTFPQERRFLDTEKNCQQICDNKVDYDHEQEEVSSYDVTELSHDCPEYIFELSYKRAVGETKTDWRVYCKNVDVVSKIDAKETISNLKSTATGIGQWVQVNHDENFCGYSEQNLEVAVDAYSTDKYSSYFEHYSNVLSNYGPWFEDVNTFDDWYAQWREELQGVTDYVQQSIYLEEMNKFEI